MSAYSARRSRVRSWASRSGDPDYFAFNEYVDFGDDAAEQAYLAEVSPGAFIPPGILCGRTSGC